jgi:hypothetical protein
MRKLYYILGLLFLSCCDEPFDKPNEIKEEKKETIIVIEDWLDGEEGRIEQIY